MGETVGADRECTENQLFPLVFVMFWKCTEKCLFFHWFLIGFGSAPNGVGGVVGGGEWGGGGGGGEWGGGGGAATGGPG